MTQPRRPMPPWQVLVPMVLLGLVAALAAAVVVGGVARGGLLATEVLVGLPIVLLLGMVVVGLWQRRRGARLVGFVAGAGLVVYGLSVSVAGAPALELLVGLVISILLATRAARQWVRPG